MFYFFFYYPLGLDVRPTRPVWLTWSLAGTALLLFAVTLLDPAWFLAHQESLIYVPAHPTLAALLSSAFMHGDWLHLSSNLLALGVFGPALEARLGAWRFAAVFAVCHVAGNLVQGAMALLWFPDTAGWGVLGASGALSGLLGVFLVRLHWARLRVGYWAFLPLQAYTQAGTRTLPVLAAVGLWFLLQLGLAAAQLQGAAASVAVGSHLGGLMAGIGMGWLLGLRGEGAAEQHLQQGRRHFGSAAWYPAQGEFLAYVRRCPEDPEGHLELARSFRLTARHGEAETHFRRACAGFALQKRLDRLEEAHREAARGNPDFVLAAPLQLQLGRVLERGCKDEAAARVYGHYLRAYPGEPAVPFALFRLARLTQARSGLAQARPHYVELLLQHPAAPEAEMARWALAAQRPTRSRGTRT
ncbi:MAG TPA: rhomboid family intramembrane serine protease [Candidatus Krumholzibacteria bacterium]|nr:rhomboid family intramembrane serine protease [Candidatus Krumholzibacteria bacterium]